MDQRIINLASTTFSGRRVNRRQIADIQETVALFPHDSRNELAKTICEHLGWKTAKGAYRVGACLGMLETLESHGILTLLAKREKSVRAMKAIDAPAWTSASDPQPEIAAPLAALRPLRLEPVTDTPGRQLWNALVDHHHSLGYRRPFGAHIRYIVTDRQGRRLGCLLFEAATKVLPCRDRWIGWSDRARDRHRHLMVVKGVYVMPLDPACRAILRGARQAARPTPPTAGSRSASKHSSPPPRPSRRSEDARWQQRKRVFDSLLIMLFVLRLVAAPRGQGYRTTLCALWEQCTAAGVALPQDEPPAASTACVAREKLDEAAFRCLHAAILATGPDCPSWKGRRILAVDGSKITLPRELADHGFRVADGAHDPQGMVSVLYRLRDRIPVDFDLFDHENERTAALAHLDHAAPGDVIVYDRGYDSFAMALAHQERGLDFVFRIKKTANPAFDAFIASGEKERTITLDAPRDETALQSRTLRVRLVAYGAGDTHSCLATSLHDSTPFNVRVLSDIDHGRWGVEEMDKTGKAVTESFHARSVRGVRQELDAAFTLVTLARQFSNRCDDDINGGDREEDLPAMRSNVRNGLRLVGREIEALFLAQTVARIMTGLSRCLQRDRPGRSDPRQSMQPRSTWQTRHAG